MRRLIWSTAFVRSVKRAVKKRATLRNEIEQTLKLLAQDTFAPSPPMTDFVICINSDSNPASLILGKVYRTRPDSDAEGHHMLRVVDEDKPEPDGYLYPASMFAPIELPEVAERALMTTGD